MDKTLKLHISTGKIDTTKPYWRLYREHVIQRASEKLCYVVYALDSQFELLEYELNNRNCFDFSYQPLNNDKLHVDLFGLRMNFIYDGHRWYQNDGEENEVTRTMQAKGYIRNTQ